MEENNTQQSASQSGEAQQPSASEQRITQIETELADLSPDKISALERGSQRRAAVERRRSLEKERIDLILKPVIDADFDKQPPEQEAERHEPPAGKGYELQIDETITGTDREEAAEYAADLGQLGKDAGLSQDVTQGLFDLVANLQLTDTSGVNGCNSDETIAMLSNRYGPEAAKQLVADCQAAVKRLSPAIRAYLDQPMDAMGARLGDMPAVIIALAHLHRGDLNLSPAQAQAEIKKLRGGKAYVTGDRATVDRVRVLSRIASRGDRNEVPMRSHAVPNTKSQGRGKLEAEAKQIRLDKGYWDKAAPNHRALQARMAELMQQLSQEA